MSSSDSASTEESSGHSEKVRRLLLLDNEQDDERGGGRGAKTQTASDQSKISMYLGIHMVRLLTVTAALSQSQASHIQLCGFVLTYCCLSGCWSAAQMKARCWFSPFLSPSLRPPSTSPSLPKNWRKKTQMDRMLNKTSTKSRSRVGPVVRNSLVSPAKCSS